MKGLVSRRLCFCAVVIAAAAATRAAVADTVTFTVAGEGYFDFYGAAVDPSTGKIYVRTSYTTDGSGSNTVRVYDNAAALAAHTSSQTLTTAGGQGTYIAASDGKLYGRYETRTPGSSPSDTTSARWEAATGATESVGSSMPGMGGVNGADTFTVGLFTAANWMQDQTGLYVLGHNAGESTWQLDRMNSDLTIADTTTFDAGPLGYAFMIDGKLFTSSHHESTTIDHVLDLSTGAYTAVNFTWTGLGPVNAVDDAFYDVTRDTLYLHDYDHGTFYAAANASQQFHAASPVEQAPSTPLPGAATAGAALLGGLAAKRRPRRPAAAE